MSLAPKPLSWLDARSMNVPYRKPRRTWAGHGNGAPCDLCGEPIESDQIEYEVEFSDDGRIPALNLHIACFEVWTTTGLED